VVLFCLGARNSATSAVEAIWMGSAINSDGRSSALAAPNGIAQMLVISQGEREWRAPPVTSQPEIKRDVSVRQYFCCRSYFLTGGGCGCSSGALRTGGG
jgi:hypothetical protein